MAWELQQDGIGLPCLPFARALLKEYLKISPSCMCLSMTANVLQALIWGLQVNFSK